MAPLTYSHWQEWVIRRLRDRGRRLLVGLERCRANALRRNPARLRRGLREARSVLILCNGNVIRSVFATHLLTASLDERSTIAVRSAGLATEPGWRAHPRVIRRCAALNRDLRGHLSVAATKTMVEMADVVLVMEIAQLVVVARRFRRAHRKTFLLASLATDVPIEIEDPVGKDDAAVDACLDHIERALKPVIEIIADRGPAAGIRESEERSRTS